MTEMIKSISLHYTLSGGERRSIELSIEDLDKAIDAAYSIGMHTHSRVRCMASIRSTLNVGLFSAVRIFEFITHLHPLFKSGIFISMIKGDKS